MTKTAKIKAIESFIKSQLEKSIYGEGFTFLHFPFSFEEKRILKTGLLPIKKERRKKGGFSDVIQRINNLYDIEGYYFGYNLSLCLGFYSIKTIFPE